jgi:hypothetical protein
VVFAGTGVDEGACRLFISTALFLHQFENVQKQT